jgi:cytochrome b561
MDLGRPQELGPHLERSSAAWRAIVGEVDKPAFAVFGRLEAVARLWATLQRDALSSHGLNYAEYTTIGMLRTSLPDLQRSPTELRRLVGQSSAGMTRILAKLEDEGLVRRVAHADDGRRVDVALTARGAAVAEKAFRSLMRAESELLATMPRQRRAAVRAGLDALLEAFAVRREQTRPGVASRSVRLARRA